MMRSEAEIREAVRHLREAASSPKGRAEGLMVPAQTAMDSIADALAWVCGDCDGGFTELMELFRAIDRDELRARMQ